MDHHQASSQGYLIISIRYILQFICIPVTFYGITTKWTRHM
uniref:Uncharacterized protein n=1 Tax=Arundo donax TaxID=35708 RepID=A0A0A9FJF5_ARUDO